MNFLDMLKNNVVEQFSVGVTVPQMLASLCVAFLMGAFVLLVYRLTYRGVLFSKGFAYSLILLCMVTAVIIRTISSNLALSLGMVGALSIVRFRTAVKDPVDTMFMFWVIACGIMSGAGLYVVGGLACLLVGLLYVIVCTIYRKNKCPYLLIVRYDPEKFSNVKRALHSLPRYRVKSRTVTRHGGELTVEVALKGSESSVLDTFLSTEGVLDASLVSYESEFGL